VDRSNDPGYAPSAFADTSFGIAGIVLDAGDEGAARRRHCLRGTRRAGLSDVGVDRCLSIIRRLQPPCFRYHLERLLQLGRGAELDDVSPGVERRHVSRGRVVRVTGLESSSFPSAKANFSRPLIT
jgi:hypothetical protein